ncbi:MAG: hypothetical protein AB1782_11760 [Cyanobacteriota bacterium]
MINNVKFNVALLRNAQTFNNKSCVDLTNVSFNKEKDLSQINFNSADKTKLVKKEDNSESSFQVVDRVNESLNNLYKNETGLRQQLSQYENNSIEAKRILKQLETLNGLKVSIVNKLSEEYPKGSANSNALQITGNLLNENFKMDMIQHNLEAVQGNIGELNIMIEKLQADSPERSRVQKQIEALNQVGNALCNKKSETNQNIKQLNSDLKPHLNCCSSDIKATIKNIKIQENYSDRVASDAREMAKEEKRNSISSYLNKLNQSKIELVSSKSNVDPDEAEASSIQARIEAMNDIEGRLLSELQNTYPANSKQAKAVDSMIKINNFENQKDNIDGQLNSINGSINNIDKQLESIKGSDSAEKSLLLQRREQMENIKNKLEQDNKTVSKDLTKEKVKLKRNIVGSPAADRKFLADIRSEHLKTKLEIQENKLNNISDSIKSMKDQLKNNNIDNNQNEKIQARIEDLRQEFLALKRTNRIDKQEEKLWSMIEKMPVNTINNLTQRYV